jgi:peptidoglycan/xylan/chitin deacetylase (PgdA/CDA1 family)
MSLRSTVREGAAQALRWSGAPAAQRWVHSQQCAAILLYHDPKPDVFDAHLLHLRERYVFTSLDTIVDAIERGDWRAVPSRALVVTFDDGHRGNYDLLPLFQRHGLRPTLYLCSQVVTTRRRFWFKQPGVDTLPYVRKATEERLEALRRLNGFELEQERPEERQALSADEIAAMAPWVDFGAHSRFHATLPCCEEEEARREVLGSRQELEALLGRPVRHFAYPNGDYGEREIALVKQAGFASARTIDLGWTRVDSDPYRLPTFGVTDDASVAMLAAQLSGIPGYLRRMLQGSPGGRWPQPRARSDP